MIYDNPGRGCWRTTGGCLPLSPGSIFGYYREAQNTERPVGMAWFQRVDTSDSAHCVNTGVKVIQQKLNENLGTTLVVDGWFGPKTAAAGIAFQKANNLGADGIIGPHTMRALLKKDITRGQTEYSIPNNLIDGLIGWESGWDPAGVGDNGLDHGLAQINLAVFTLVTWEQAMDPVYSVAFAGHNMRRIHDQWVGKTTADPWDIAIANHNAPALAYKWATSGVPPIVPGAGMQIADYVGHVRKTAISL